MSQFAEMKSGAEMRDHILGKATEDAAFRTRLVADPKATLNRRVRREPARQPRHLGLRG